MVPVARVSKDIAEKMILETTGKSGQSTSIETKKAFI